MLLCLIIILGTISGPPGNFAQGPGSNALLFIGLEQRSGSNGRQHVSMVCFYGTDVLLELKIGPTIKTNQGREDFEAFPRLDSQIEYRSKYVHLYKYAYIYAFIYILRHISVDGRQVIFRSLS